MQTITKEFLEQCYLQQKLSQETIAKKCHCSRRWIGKLLKKFSISSRPCSNLVDMQIDLMQREIIVASILGDGSIVKNGNHCRLQIAHGCKQKKYLLWKMRMLNPIVVQNPVLFHSDEWMIYSHNHIYFDQLRDMFYPCGKKNIRNYAILNNIGALGLAVWFMDDGTHGVSHSSQMIISTQSFSQKSHVILQQWLNKKFDLHPKVLKYISEDKRYCRLYFNVSESRKLAKIINPYIISSMRYKIKNILQEPVETIRRTPINIGDDIVRTAWQHAEHNRNDYAISNV